MTFAKTTVMQTISILVQYPDDLFSMLKSNPYCVINSATIDDKKCTYRLNFILWLYWDADINGVALHHLELLKGRALVIATKNKTINIDLINKKYCDGTDIIFNEVSLGVQ